MVPVLSSLVSRSLTALLLVASAGIGTTAAGAANEPGKKAGTETERRGSVLVDPLGFVMFGPRIGVEVGGSHFTGGLVARWFDAGLLGRRMFLSEGNDFAFSYGVGVRARYYLRGEQSGLHIGGGAEYLSSRVENASASIVTTSGYVVPYTEAGYRYSFGAFFGGVSVVLGYAARLSGRVEDLPGGNSARNYAASNESSIYGSAALEIGTHF